MTLTITIDLNAQPADITRELHRVAALITRSIATGDRYGMDNITLTDELGEIGRTSVDDDETWTEQA